MGFVIKKIVVHSEPTRVRGGETHYNMVREKWDVRTLLEVYLCHLYSKYFYDFNDGSAVLKFYPNGV